MVPTITPVRGQSGALYNTRDLSPESNKRATEGLAADFYVDRLQSHENMDHSDAYYAFQLKKPVSVRIHDPALGVNRVKCSCGGGEDPICCEHIYASTAYSSILFLADQTQWLFDALNAVLKGSSTPSIRTLTRDSVVTEISGLFDLIGERINSLPDLLNSIRGSESDDDEEIAARKLALREMLSVFDQEALPEEYLQNLPDVPTDLPIDQLFVPWNLGATIYRLAVRDESIYASLERVLHRDICARYYLTKQRGKARQAMRNLDQRAQTEPSNNPTVQDMDVGECGRTLRRIVWEICQYREASISKGPLKAETTALFSEVLVEILEGVCERNRDIGTENLYARLIGDPPRPAAPEEEGAFVIDHLRNFPSEEWRHLTERLDEIAEDVRQNAPHERHPSLRFASQIDEMVQDYVDDEDVFEPSSLAVQHPRRPTMSDERERQRPRFG